MTTPFYCREPGYTVINGVVYPDGWPITPRMALNGTRQQMRRSQPKVCAMPVRKAWLEYHGGPVIQTAA